MIGTLLCGRYRLEDQIGSGGMSTVYRAFDETLERWVAIKVLHVALSHDPLQLERFRREARTIARLSHPHIVTVIDAGEDDGHPFIVLEYIEGETLKARVRRVGRLPVVEATHYALEIARALIAAHALRLVHRDVKPQNVLIDRSGRAKVTDFGISRSLEDDGLTATGRVLGTTDYVAPEQALGDCTCEQSDIYSLGVCLYEMLCGDVPFKADSQVGVAMKHVRDPVPDVRLVRPRVSASLAAVVERATAKERCNRYQTAAAMVAELEQALAVELARAGQAREDDTNVLRAAPPRRRRLRPARVAAAAALVAAVAGAAGAAIALRPHHRPRQRVASAAPRPLAPQPLVKVAVYDPFGDGIQNSSTAPNAIAGNPNSFWESENYSPGGGLGSKPGLGLDVEAKIGVPGRQLQISTPLPGANVEIYAQNVLPTVTPGRFGDWGAPIGRATLSSSTTIPLSTDGRSYRYYLIWITKLPPQDVAELADIRLFS